MFRAGVVVVVVITLRSLSAPVVVMVSLPG